MDKLQEVLQDRGESYGDYEVMSVFVQTLKELMDSRSPRYTPVMRESIDMICLKMGRLAVGDVTKVDTWRDIAGYAELVAEILEKQQHIEGYDDQANYI